MKDKNFVDSLIIYLICLALGASIGITISQELYAFFAVSFFGFLPFLLILKIIEAMRE